MIIEYWSDFKKRENSTKIPTGGISINAVLKMPCSVQKPVLQLKNISINYFKIKHSYYFVSNVIQITNDIIEVYGTLDVLATYKTDILSTRAYVERSSSSYNVHITDPMNTPTYEISRNTSEIELPAFNFSVPGSFVIGVRGRTEVAGNESGFINYFNMDGAQLAALANAFNDSGIIDDIILSLSDVMDTITCLYYVPFAYGSLGGAQSNLYFGDVNSGITCMQMFARQRGQSAYMRVPISIPQLEDEEGQLSRCYLRTHPYTEMLLTLPFLGVVKLDPSMFYDVDNVGVEYHLDLMTGDILYKIGKSGNDGNTLYSIYSANCYSAVPVARTSHEWLRLASILESGSISSFANTTQALLQTHTTINGVGSSGIGIHIASKAQLTTIYRVPRETLLENLFIIGLPCKKVCNLSALAGYVLCRDASVDCAGTSEEKQQINTLLNSGIFIE